jgi:hypothetical protein
MRGRAGYGVSLYGSLRVVGNTIANHRASARSSPPAITGPIPRDSTDHLSFGPFSREGEECFGDAILLIFWQRPNRIERFSARYNQISICRLRSLALRSFGTQASS